MTGTDYEPDDHLLEAMREHEYLIAKEYPYAKVQALMAYAALARIEFRLRRIERAIEEHSPPPPTYPG